MSGDYSVSEASTSRSKWLTISSPQVDRGDRPTAVHNCRKHESHWCTPCQPPFRTLPRTTSHVRMAPACEPAGLGCVAGTAQSNGATIQGEASRLEYGRRGVACWPSRRLLGGGGEDQVRPLENEASKADMSHTARQLLPCPASPLLPLGSRSALPNTITELISASTRTSFPSTSSIWSRDH